MCSSTLSWARGIETYWTSEGHHMCSGGGEMSASVSQLPVKPHRRVASAGSAEDAAPALLDGDRRPVGGSGAPSARPANVLRVGGKGAVPLGFELERDYWLNRCVGFGVEAEGRLCGRVVLQRYRSRADCPDALVVQQGPPPGRRFSLRAEDVRAIDPWLERVYLSDAPPAAAGGPRSGEPGCSHPSAASTTSRGRTTSCSAGALREPVPRSGGRARR
jgi:hypothetical protein